MTRNHPDKLFRMQTRYLVNGEPSTTVAADDRGLQYGDGLFETLAVSNGQCEFWQAHLARLALGCQRLQLSMPAQECLEHEANRLCQDQQRAVLKIILTRGSGGRGYRPAATAATTRVLSCSAWPDYPVSHAQQGVQIRLCTLRLAAQPALGGIKHLNRLEQVLARLEWDDPNIVEGLLLDQRGHLIEGTFCNVFIVQEGRLYTPDLAHCGVAGVMRATILQLARAAAIPWQVTDLTWPQLEQADEVFLSNSLIGIWPVRQCQQRLWQPGPITRKLQEALRQLRRNKP